MTGIVCGHVLTVAVRGHLDASFKGVAPCRLGPNTGSGCAVHVFTRRALLLGQLSRSVLPLK
jgi:hypothetical protein